MFIDLNTYDEFDKKLNIDLKGQFVSPGYISNKYGVSRQLINNWISRDNLLDAYRFNGQQGYFIAIPLDEVDKIYNLRIKKLLDTRRKK